MNAHRVDDLIAIFNRLFRASVGCELVRGEDEPLYLPPSADRPIAQIVFAHGYFASALHEVAHWCIAGKRRRQLLDYGYWYKPDGRTALEQRDFERVEEKPQALEWAFSVACGKIFCFSADNLDGEAHDARPFQRAVQARVLAYLERGFPPRAARFIDALHAHYGTEKLVAENFRLPADVLVPSG